MSAEAEVEAMAMPFSVRTPNLKSDSMDAGSRGGADVQTEAMAMETPPYVETPKSSLPVLDLLHWSETPSPNPSRARVNATNDSSAFMNASDERPFLQPPVRSEVRTSQPAGGVSTISFGENLTPEESEQLQKRRPASDSKRREMIGSRIFEQETASESTPFRLARIPLAAAGMATPQRVSSKANTEGLDLSPKKPTSLSEVAKQRELGGTFFGATDTPGGRRPCSSAKSRELEGSNIFGRSTQEQLNAVSPKGFATDLSKSAGANYQQENYAPLPRTSVKVSNPAGGRSQISFGSDAGPQFYLQSKKQDHSQKAAELSGHNIIKGNANDAEPQSYLQSKKQDHSQKAAELSGHNIIKGNANDAEPQFYLQSKKQDHSQKAAELSGHNIIKGGGANAIAIASGINNNSISNPCERLVSEAKRKELLGNDIFSDASPVAAQDRPRRVRQPPGGESNLKLF